MIVFLLFILGMFSVARCAPPKVSDLLSGGIDCDVAITMPELERTPSAGEPVKVKARFANCHEVPK